jgi:hypothetical protein
VAFTTSELVDIDCPDCGQYTMPRNEFNQAESDIVDSGEERN